VTTGRCNLASCPARPARACNPPASGEQVRDPWSAVRRSPGPAQCGRHRHEGPGEGPGPAAAAIMWAGGRTLAPRLAANMQRRRLSAARVLTACHLHLPTWPWYHPPPHRSLHVRARRPVGDAPDPPPTRPTAPHALRTHIPHSPPRHRRRPPPPPHTFPPRSSWARRPLGCASCCCRSCLLLPTLATCRRGGSCPSAWPSRRGPTWRQSWRASWRGRRRRCGALEVGGYYPGYAQYYVVLAALRDLYWTCSAHALHPSQTGCQGVTDVGACASTGKDEHLAVAPSCHHSRHRSMRHSHAHRAVAHLPTPPCRVYCRSR
jgi:hypothetical protein